MGQWPAPLLPFKKYDVTLLRNSRRSQCLVDNRHQSVMWSWSTTHPNSRKKSQVHRDHQAFRKIDFTCNTTEVFGEPKTSVVLQVKFCGKPGGHDGLPGKLFAQQKSHPRPWIFWFFKSWGKKWGSGLPHFLPQLLKKYDVTMTDPFRWRSSKISTKTLASS